MYAEKIRKMVVQLLEMQSKLDCLIGDLSYELDEAVEIERKQLREVIERGSHDPSDKAAE